MTLLRKLKVAWERPARIADHFREPREIVRGGVAVNALGLQLARIGKDAVLWRMRSRRPGARVREACEVLEREGILVVPNYLSPTAFAEVSQELHRAERDHSNSWKSCSFGENLVAENIFVTDYPERYPAFMRYLRDDDFLLGVACAVSKRRPTYRPHLDVQRISKPDPSAPHVDLDYNQFLHTDRHYPFVKAFLYMSDVDRDNAPYTFVPGSHKMWTYARLRYEYEYSVAYARARRRKYVRDRAQLERDRSLERLAVRTLEELGLVPHPIIGPANTLIVCNNQGFHRRGELRGPGPRVTVFIDFKYLESPAQWMFPVMRHLYRPDQTVSLSR